MSPFRKFVALHDERGFSLAEMLVVLSIMAMICLSLSSIFGNQGKLSRQRSVQAAHDELAAAAQTARRKGKRVVVRISGPGLTVRTATGEPADRIVFRADGSSSGGYIYADGRPVLLVDTLFGRAHAI